MLAQYATPAELLMAPADDFVEDFVGADRALKRLALTRVGDLDLRPVDNGLPFRLIRDEAGRPVAWERAGERYPVRTVGSDESLRDVLSELLLTPLALGAVVDGEGRVQGRARRRAHPRAAGAREPGAGRGMSAPTRSSPRPADDFFRDRSNEGDSCVANNGFCPDWIVHHLDRYVSPFWQHLFLVVVSVGLGFVIAFALALLAHRRRWLVGPITQVTGILYTIPSLAFFFLLLPITGRGNTTALIALTAYTLLILFRNIVDGLDGVPDGGARRRPRDGPHRPPAAVARRAAAGAAGDHGRAAHRRDDDGRARRAGHLRGRRRARRPDGLPEGVHLQHRRRRRRCAC